MESNLAFLPALPTLHDSVTHVVCSPRVCGLRGDPSTITTSTTCDATNLVDGSSNICVTGEVGLLLDVVDIPPFKISVALEGDPTSFDNCITKKGLLPLSLSDGTTYYQTCYFCANMVETIISPLAILDSSDVFVQWTQEGFKDRTIPGRILFTSHDGLLNMSFQLECRNGLYYCSTDVYTVDPTPIHVYRLRADDPALPDAFFTSAQSRLCPG
jgi:hypothetical protein